MHVSMGMLVCWCYERINEEEKTRYQLQQQQTGLLLPCNIYAPVHIVLPNEINTLVEYALSDEPHTQGVQVEAREYLTITGTGTDIMGVANKLYGGMM